MFRYGYTNLKYSKPSHTNRDTLLLLKSGYTAGQTWKGLSKAWIGYNIAKNDNDVEKMIHYANIILKLQNELADAGIVRRENLATFPHLNLAAATT